MDDKQGILDELKALGDDLRSRLELLDRRVEELEKTVRQAAPGNNLPAAPLSPTLEQALGLGDGKPAVESRTIAVTISPLHDVSWVRVVEAALGTIEGVESATLRELHGAAAHLDVKVHGDVPLISGLRRALPVAFDVTASDRSSYTIALAQPGAEREGGVAAHNA